MESLKIVKIGSSVLSDPETLKGFLSDFSTLEGKKILVHGGGKHATELAGKLNVKVKMVEGRRITCEDTLDIITMSYAGKINKAIVALLQSMNCNALGLTGADGNSIEARKRPVVDIDYGFVGDVVKVNHSLFSELMEMKIIPVLCAVTHDRKGNLLNTNADTIATEIALGLAHMYDTELFFCSEKSGVLESIDDPDSLIPCLTPEFYSEIKEKDIISDGMIPKLDNCMHALKNNVSKIFIGDHNLLKHGANQFTTIQK